jgi:hypothetical protein
MTIQLANYYDRFAAADNYDRHLFRSGNFLQAAELNELQSASMARLQQVADVLFNDGAQLEGAECITSTANDVCTCQCTAGAVYLRGAARGVPPRTFTIPATGRVAVGIYLVDSIATELDDPDLRDPSISPLNNQEPGAARLQVTPTWGYAGDGRAGAFYPVHDIEDGLLLTKAPPPQVDAMAQYVARYDRQSAGGYYISNGMKVTRLPDINGKQVYSMADGVARIGGVEIIRQHARRFEYTAVADSRAVSLETHIVPVEASLGDDFTITFNRTPVNTITSVSVQRQITHSMIHGPSGGTDTLPFGPVIDITAVSQDEAGTQPYVETTSWVQAGDSGIDWAPGGAEPSNGGTYWITYIYWESVPLVELVDVSETAATVDGTKTVTVRTAVTAATKLVPNTPTFSTYSWSIPRIDRICLDQAGEIVWIKGVAATANPRTPAVPVGALGIAIVEQRWGPATRVVTTAVRLVAMNDLNDMQTNINTLFALMAEERLALNLTQRDQAAKKGVFADPLLDDDMRDEGVPQTAAVFRGTLVLGLETVVHTITLDEPGRLNARVLVELDETVTPEEILIAQPLRTSTMKVNPYDSFAPMPGVAILSPATDYWLDFMTNWLSPVTRQFDETVWLDPIFSSNAARVNVISTETTSSSDVEKVGTRYVELQTLREITIGFSLSGFGVGENLTAVRFDGIAVTPREAP